MNIARRVLPLVACIALAAASDPLVPLSLRQVKVQGEIGRRIDTTVRNNLLALDIENDFLRPFRIRDPKSSYIGLGKLLLSAVRLAAYTGDVRVVGLKDRLVAETIALQEAGGYIGLFTPAARVHTLWDVHELGYIVAGLLADYEYFGSARSLEASRKAAGYLLQHWNRIPPRWAQDTGVAEHVAVTGIERTLLALHRATGDRRYLDFLLDQRALAQWNFPIVIGRRPGIEGHIYAYMARALAQLELYRLDPRPALLVNADRALDFLIRGDGMAITGAAGQFEIWTDDQDGRGELGETCATAYQLRVYDSLLRLRGESRFGDLMERTIYNTLFAAQSPDGRRLRYYAPLEGPRQYHPTDTYCCPCNYRRIVAELPEFVYYRAGTGIAVNLFTASEATVEAGGSKVRISQETNYPSGGAIVIRLSPERPARFPLRIRIPAWAAGARVTIPGAEAAAARPGSFFESDREWRAGDAVQIELPMPIRLVKGRRRQAGRAAVMRGPLVFCLNPSADKVLAGLDGADLGRFTLDPASMEVVPDDSVRPDGVACRVGAWKPDHSLGPKPPLRLRFTEFPDPGGLATYFRLRDLELATSDELSIAGFSPRL